jgi:hypothetical protein
VYRTKRALSIGQGKRATLHSCHCLHQFEPVGTDKLEPMRVDIWQGYLDFKPKTDLGSPNAKEEPRPLKQPNE